MRDNKLIQFYLTNMCNSKCKTCSIWKNKNIEEIDIERVKEIMKQFPEADYVLGGGEFTLYRKRHELLEWCDENKIKYTILSNAVNTRLLRDLLDNHKVNNLTISCDGVNHDDARGIDGNLENIKTIVNEYKDKIKNIKLSYTFSSFNEKYFEESMIMFRNMGFEKIYFCLAQNMDLLISNDSVVASNNEIILNNLDMLYDKDKNFILSLFNDNKKTCDSTDSVFTIYTNGDVVRCQSYLSKEVLGNIYKENFKDIIDNCKKLEKCKYDKICNLVCQRRYD